MPLVYWHPQDEDAPPKLSAAFVDEDAGWWSGVFQCAVQVALAATLSVSATTAQAVQVYSYHQDDPAGKLTATVDEYFWQDPSQPLLSYLPTPQVFPYDDVIVPQPVAFQPDEDFQIPIIIKVSTSYPDPFSFDSESPQLPATHGWLDEDFWQNGVSPVMAMTYLTLPGSFDAVDIIPQAAAAVQNYIGPPGARNYVTQDIGSGIEF